MEALRPMVDHCHGALSYPMLSQEKSYLISSNLIQPNLVYSNPSILFIYLCVCVCMYVCMYACDAMRCDAIWCDAMYLCLRLSLAKSAHRPPRGAAGGTRSGRRRSGSRTCAAGLHRRRWWNPCILMLKHGKLEHNPAKVRPIGWDQPCTKKACHAHEWIYAYIMHIYIY